MFAKINDPPVYRAAYLRTHRCSATGVLGACDTSLVIVFEDRVSGLWQLRRSCRRCWQIAGKSPPASPRRCIITNCYFAHYCTLAGVVAPWAGCRLRNRPVLRAGHDNDRWSLRLQSCHSPAAQVSAVDRTHLRSVGLVVKTPPNWRPIDHKSVTLHY
jgi:hypothetical protein